MQKKGQRKMKKTDDIKKDFNINRFNINIETLLILGLIHEYKKALNQIFNIIETDILDDEDVKSEEEE